MKDKDELLSPKAASRLLDVPLSWIYGKSHEGAFPPEVAFKVGVYLRFSRKRLLEWVETGGARR